MHLRKSSAQRVDFKRQMRHDTAYQMYTNQLICIPLIIIIFVFNFIAAFARPSQVDSMVRWATHVRFIDNTYALCVFINRCKHVMHIIIISDGLCHFYQLLSFMCISTRSNRLKFPFCTLSDTYAHGFFFFISDEETLKKEYYIHRKLDRYEINRPGIIEWKVNGAAHGLRETWIVQFVAVYFGKQIFRWYFS